MSKRYWITGVQLGCLIAWEHKKTRNDLAKEIIAKQFIGKFFSQVESKKLCPSCKHSLFSHKLTKSTRYNE